MSINIDVMDGDSMPYKSEKIKLKPTQDRRRKLTDEDIEEIKKLYVPNVFGTQKIANMFGVSKRTIQLIVSPQVKETVQRYRKEHWREFQRKGEEWNKTMREHRRYKQELYVKGELK